MPSAPAADHILCRSSQASQLNTLLQPSVPTPPSIVLHGPPATGKSLALSSFLSSGEVLNAVITSQECITGRHLLEHSVQSVRESLEAAGYSPLDHLDSRCENLGSLAAQLQALLATCPRFYLVFDGIDRQREAPQTLVPALARMAELIPALTVMFIVHYAPTHLLRHPGAPHIAFPAYSRAESIQIASQNPLPFPPSTAQTPTPSKPQPPTDEDASWLYPRFAALVWDALAHGAARDVVSFQRVCHKLWPPFVAPVIAGAVGARDLPRLVNRTRAIFQSEDGLVESLIPKAGTVAGDGSQGTAGGNVGGEVDRRRIFRSSQSLTYSQSHLLVAAYLASHNPSRLDSVYFMKMHEKKRKRRNRLTSQAISASGLKHYKVQRRLLGAQGFAVERLLAIYAAILPFDPQRGGATLPQGADVLGEFATLAALRLIVKAGGAADVTDPAAKWRVNVGWEFVKNVARGVGFPVEEYIAE